MPTPDHAPVLAAGDDLQAFAERIAAALTGRVEARRVAVAVCPGGIVQVAVLPPGAGGGGERAQRRAFILRVLRAAAPGVLKRREVVARLEALGQIVSPSTISKDLWLMAADGLVESHHTKPIGYSLPRAADVARLESSDTKPDRPDTI